MFRPDRVIIELVKYVKLFDVHGTVHRDILPDHSF